MGFAVADVLGDFNKIRSSEVQVNDYSEEQIGMTDFCSGRESYLTGQ